MKPQRRKRAWVEMAIAFTGAALLVLTLVWSDWIEGIFGVGPDRGDGTLEWGVTVSLVAVTLVSAIVARAEWKRPRALASSATEG